MKKIAYLFAVAVITTSCSAQKTVSDKKTIEKYLKTITAPELKKHLTVIASDEMEGRETGSAGQKKAGKYMIAQYEADKIPFPKGASDYYQKVPAVFMNGKRSNGLPDSENIWAFIEGSEKPEEVVVLSAHYDHVGIENGVVFNGADDDGSGTVALMEIAQALQIAKNEGYGPKRSVLILHVTGEEHGLHGSRYYAENPLFPLKNTVADVNIDMIGRRDKAHASNGNYIYLIGSDFLSTELDAICKKANKDFAKLDLDFTYNSKKDPNQFYYRSDHYNFAKNGIPSVFLFSGVHEDYHKPTDDVEKIEFDLVEKRAKLAFAVVWELANREQKIVVDKKD